MTIIGFSNYEVSETGNIYRIRPTGKSILKPYKNRKGYLMVKLYNEEGNKGFSVHRLVAMCYIGNPNNLPQVNHKDGDKLNNNISNLEWVSCQDNISHAIEHNLRSRTINLIPGRLFDSNKLNNIFTMIGSGRSNMDIANIYNCHHSTISKIRTGKNYNYGRIN